MSQAFNPAKAKEKKKILNAKQVNLKEFSRLLVIAPFSVEDFILCTPAIEALKQAMPPEGKITVLASEDVLKVSKSCAYIDKTLLIKSMNPFAVLATLMAVNSAKYQLVMSFNHDLLTAFLVNMATSAKAKVAYAQKNEKGMYNSLHNLLLHSNDNTQHKIIRYLNLARFIGANTYDFIPKLSIPDEDCSYAKDFFRKNNITGSDLLVGLHPSSKNGKKRWSLSKFQQLTLNLTDKYNCKVVAFAHKDEHDRLKEYMVVTKKKAIIVDTDDYMKMAAVARFLCCFVCNETDLMHVFAPFTNIVAIWGNTDPEENKPAGAHNEILTAPDGNSDSIPVSVVTDAVRKFITQNDRA
jgi:ADP-heptose:LPS heptosyltransferase